MNETKSWHVKDEFVVERKTDPSILCACAMSVLLALYCLFAQAGGRSLYDLLDRQQALDQSVWLEETQAQRFESRFVELWDQLRRSDAPWEVLAAFPFAALTLAEPGTQRKLELGILHTRFRPGGQTLSPAQWRGFLKAYREDGYRLVQSEWHHERFTPATADSTAVSEIGFELHVERTSAVHRIIARGVLRVDWRSQRSTAEQPVPEWIAVTELDLLERRSGPAFREVLTVPTSVLRPRMQPLLVYDLDGDGLSEIALGGLNRIGWNRGEFQFDIEELLPRSEAALEEARILADFTGDGRTDVVATNMMGELLIYEGSEDGRFRTAGRRAADVRLEAAKSMTAGDIDGDGDLDLFAASYKTPYVNGQMPTPYYDANDGYPAYLLLNDGHGRFRDATIEAGLARKRNRRTFSSSLVDLDDDRDLDLVVISDFAGLDLYENDGRGQFRDRTQRLGAQRHFFGMGHTFGDYDRDGRLDLYVIGMSSTTARRLDRLGLGPPGRDRDNALRTAMSYGNRLFLGRADGLELAPFNDRVARTGWSWGTTSFDFDNDGDQDIFVANGHISGRSARDYCSTFWRHDIYTDEDGSRDDPIRSALYSHIGRDLYTGEMSWNGFEHKRLLMNLGGRDFVDVAFLLGVAFEYDARAVVTADIDADGRMDLLAVELESMGNGVRRFHLHVYRNELEASGHWIGVDLRDHAYGLSAIGATVFVETTSGTQMRRIVTGDSFSAQHPASAHFGLGSEDRVSSLRVRWANGVERHIQRPAVGRYHRIDPELNNLEAGVGR